MSLIRWHYLKQECIPSLLLSTKSVSLPTSVPCCSTLFPFATSIIRYHRSRSTATMKLTLAILSLLASTGIVSANPVAGGWQSSLTSSEWTSSTCEATWTTYPATSTEAITVTETTTIWKPEVVTTEVSDYSMQRLDSLPAILPIWLRNLRNTLLTAISCARCLRRGPALSTVCFRRLLSRCTSFTDVVSKSPNGLLPQPHTWRPQQSRSQAKPGRPSAARSRWKHGPTLRRSTRKPRVSH